jgi:hypothetical protein
MLSRDTHHSRNKSPSWGDVGKAGAGLPLLPTVINPAVPEAVKVANV